MRLSVPTCTAYVGNVEVRGLQRVLELDALGASTGPVSLPRNPPEATPQTQQAHRSESAASESISAEDLYMIQSRTAIVVPCKDESLDGMQGVWAAIPANSLLIVVSASAPDAYACERNALAAFCQETGRAAICLHQQDPNVARALRAAGMTEYLDNEGDGLVHKGKGEAMAIGIALAATARGPADSLTVDRDTSKEPCGCQLNKTADKARRQRGGYMQHNTRGQKLHLCTCAIGDDKTSGKDNMGIVPVYYKYIGFVDADNLVPGSVQEYCRVFSAGLYLAQAQDAMVRISWASKPKVHNGKLEFKKSGRSSEIVNRWLNKLLHKLDARIETVAGDAVAADTQTDHLICTGNAGEHAMTISLALKLRVANGYAIEPFHFLDMIERFAGQRSDTLGPSAKKNRKSPWISGLTSTPESPISMSSRTSPAQSPIDGSPFAAQSLLEDSSSATSPSASSIDAYSMTAGQQLPPGITTEISPLQEQPADEMTPPISPVAMTGSRATVQVLQIRTINPHFHADKGEEHVAKMWKQGLSAIYHSPLTESIALNQYRERLRRAIQGYEDLEEAGKPSTQSPTNTELVEQAADVGTEVWQPERCRIYKPVGLADLFELREKLEAEDGSFWRSR